jgi:hypothetical protein
LEGSISQKHVHLNNSGKEKMCQQIVELVQQKFRTVDNAIPINVIPLEYKENSVHEMIGDQVK